ncbi:extracellular solute-binding protein [Litorivicinus lipolyticus]|uniref:extracellular solute-binding protein n=1 Tax=Litorivicinus lipolyticus TaxID=418701 RepID=UPI003B59258E
MLKSLVAASLLLALGAQAAGQVNVYSARNEALILPLLEQFEASTGIDVRLITGGADELVTRMKSEGVASPADVFITVDAGRAQRAKQAGVLAKLGDQDFLSRVPAPYQDADNEWVALSLRARTIFYSKARFDPSQISNYADLADPKFKGQLCIRSSGNIYNQSLTAAQIEHQGDAAALDWARGMVANMARKPSGGDTDQIKAVAAGLCDIAVANTYYFGRLAASESADDQAVVDAVGMIWPDQSGAGTHVNASLAGIASYSPNRDNAEALLGFLLSDAAQTFYAEINHEFPVVTGALPSKTMRNLGAFKADGLSLEVLGVNNPAAVKLMDKAGWL